MVCHSLLQWTTFCHHDLSLVALDSMTHHFTELDMTVAHVLCGLRRAERSYSTFKVRRGSCEEIPLIQGKDQQLCFAKAAMKRYPTCKVRETPVRQ